MKGVAIGIGLGVVALVVLGAVVFTTMMQQSPPQPSPTPQGTLPQVSPRVTPTSQFIFTSPAATPTPAFSLLLTPSGAPTGAGLPATSPVAAATTVAIDDNGFAPATATVKAGTAVTFTNHGQAPHWPASDPHPTHTNLAGFDSKRGLATGESYAYTFTTPGTWGFHDHLNPTVKGTVIVQ